MPVTMTAMHFYHTPCYCSFYYLFHQFGVLRKLICFLCNYTYTAELYFLCCLLIISVNVINNCV